MHSSSGRGGRVRESGMPEVSQWEQYFDPPAVLDAVGPRRGDAIAVEFGCGYGTFTLHAARRVTGRLHALDMDGAVLELARKRMRDAGIDSVVFDERDFLGEGAGIADGSVDHAMLYNILHHDEPLTLLGVAHRVLRVGGTLGIIHWRHDPETPRGPPMAIRPRPGQCLEWARRAGFDVPDEAIDLPPWHYGFRAIKN